MHAEWTKLRTVAGPGLLLLAAVVGTVALSAAASAAVSCPGAGCAADPAKTSLTGVLLGQAVIAVLGRADGRYRVQHRDDRHAR